MGAQTEKKPTFASVITAEEYELLRLPEVREAIHRTRGRDPLAVAMDRNVPHARIVATQVKYLARAVEKLPTYAAAECILPPRAFEQASSEACAAHKRIGGDTVLDITCGLGVDALSLSRRFRRVVALERDPLLARITAENFSRMGISNVEVVNVAAEEYLRREGLQFDWIYADPDRRSDRGLKQLRLEACSPDILALLPLLRRAAPRLCLKLSPLFDVDEALHLFPDSSVEVVSLHDECKEVMVYDDRSGPRIIATALGIGSFEAAGEGAGEATADVAPEVARATAGEADEASAEIAEVARAEAEAGNSVPGRFDPARYRWLVIPDVALRKARLTRQHLRGKADCWSDNGFGFAVDEPHGILGRVLPVAAIEPYDPKSLRRELRGHGVEIIKRDFPLSTDELRQRLGVRAGAERRLAFTKTGNSFWVIRIK